MKKTEIKLTEGQLAELFQNNSKSSTSSSNASDFMAASPASSDRLKHLEDLIGDRSSAEALKLSMGLKDWSQVMAESIENTRHSWFSFLGMSTPMRTAFATVTFAFVFAFALPEFSKFTNQESTYMVSSQQNMIQNDVINKVKFDGNNDRLSKGGFDYRGDKKSNNDSLFDASFG